MSANDKYTKDTEKRFTLRMDKELFEHIQKSAAKNRRSVAKEIEYILLTHLEEKGCKIYPDEDPPDNTSKG